MAPGCRLAGARDVATVLGTFDVIEVAVGDAPPVRQPDDDVADVDEIGGGAPGKGRSIKAVQMGGPSGGCVPAAHLALPIDYDSLREVGAIMGSGGLVVLDPHIAET